MVALDLPALVVDSPAVTSSFAATGQSWWYKINPGVNQGVSLNLNLEGSTGGSPGAVQLFIGQGYVPDSQHFDIEQVEWNSPSASAVIPSASSQTYYVTAYAQSLTNSPATFTLAATSLKFSLSAVQPASAVNSGSATLTFTGGGFTSGAAYQLVGSNGTVYNSSSVFLADSSHAEVTFALSGVPVGSYTAQVTENGSTVSLSKALSVTAASGSGGLPVCGLLGSTSSSGSSGCIPSGPIQINLEAPEEFRTGFPAEITLNYTNVSGADLPAPLIWLSATGATVAEVPPPCSACNPNFSLMYQNVFNSGLVLGIENQGPAGVLPAGAQGSIKFIATPTGASSVTFTTQYLNETLPDTLIGYAVATCQNDPTKLGCGIVASVARAQSQSEGSSGVPSSYVSTGTFADAAAFCTALQPPWANAAGFSRTCMQLLDNSGYQYGSCGTFGCGSLDGTGLNNQLAADATALSRMGIYEADGSRLFTFELVKDGLYSFNQRYHQGAFGFGPSHAFDITAGLLGGIPTIYYPDGSARQFPTPNPAGSNQYLGTPGDYGVLTVATDASWTLTESTGIVYKFILDPQANTTGRQLLSYIQDLNGNRITLTYTNNLVTNAVDSFGNTIAFAYDSLGHITQSTDPEGRVTTYTYDIKSDSLNSAFLTSITNSSGTASLAWNEGGPSGVGYFDDSCVTAYCQPAIGVNTITYPDGTHTYFTYDSLGRLASQYNDGSTQTVTFAYGNTGTITVTDAAGNASQIVPGEYGSPAQYTDPLGAVTQLSYDPEHKLAGLQAPLGTNYSVGYDSNSNPTTLIDALGNQQSMSFTSYNNPLSFTGASGYTTAYTYDRNYNLTGMAYPDGSAMQYTYDSRGNVTSWTNRRGHTITYGYNSQNLLTSKTYANGAQVSYTYDGHRNLLSSVTALWGTTNFTYDSADRLTGVAYPSGQSIQYVYNSGGQRTSITDSTGFTVNYSYDAVGRLSQLTNGSGAPIVSYAYDAAGRLARKTMGNGTHTTYAYDADGNPLHLINYSSGGAVLSEFDYSYDALGNRTAMNTSSGAWTYGYDADSQITSVVLPGGSVQYTYDANGNRVSSSTTSYSVNNLNEYTAAGATAYRYDADGNLIAGGGWTYRYDDENRLIGMARATDTWTYRYDGFGNRVAAEHNGTWTQYLNDPTGVGNVVAEFDGSGNLVSHYTYGLGLASAVPATGSTAYYHFDAAGNTAQMTNASGSVVNSYSYLPFGEKLSSTAGVANPFTYVGEYGVMDEGSGLYFMRNRWYDPAIGRFVQQDPIGMAGDTNLYRYTANNPLAFVDPDGTDGSPAQQNPPQQNPPQRSPTQPDYVADAANSTVGHFSNAFGGFIPNPMANFAVGSANNVGTLDSFAHNWNDGDRVGATHDAAMALTREMGLIPITPETPPFLIPFAVLGKWSGLIDEGSQLIFNTGFNYWYAPPPVTPHLFNQQPTNSTTDPTARSFDPNGKLTSGFGDQGSEAGKERTSVSASMPR